ncbi:MAG: hypothetical protein AAFO03_16995, partial [Bacteroidota bacterium]
DDNVPDDNVPDDNVPDDNVSDDNVPDDNVPDDNVPDDNVPDDNVPDDNVPDDNVPDDNVSDDNVPDKSKLPQNAEIRSNTNGNEVTLIDKSTNETVGYAVMDEGGIVDLAIYRKDLKTTLRGRQVFEALIDEFRMNGRIVKGIRGNWSGKSDNLFGTQEGNKGINTILEENPSLSAEEAATKTWTGRRAGSEGFKNAQVIESTPSIKESNPNLGRPFTNMEVLFY